MTGAGIGTNAISHERYRVGSRMLVLMSDQHRDVANLVTGIGVAVRFGDLVEPISAADHRAQLAGVDQLLQEDEIGLRGIGGAGDESCSSEEVYERASQQRPCNSPECP